MMEDAASDEVQAKNEGHQGNNILSLGNVLMPASCLYNISDNLQQYTHEHGLCVLSALARAQLSHVYFWTLSYKR